MGRSARRATLLRLALVMMTSESHHMSRGEPGRGGFVYECPNGHTRRLRHYRETPPLCHKKGCGLRMKYVPQS